MSLATETANWPDAVPPRADNVAQTDINGELKSAKAEPWVPVETKLVAWSLGIGVALLILLVVANRLYPAAL